MNTRAKSMALAEVDPAAVIVSGRRRLINEAWAEAIAATIAERGQDTPTKIAAAEDAIQGRRSPRGKNQTQQALDKLIAAWARAPKRAQSGFIDYLAELGLATRV